MKNTSKKNGNAPSGKVRYAVVGLGHIAQSAVLPAFANAKKNSEVTALISDDPLKREKLGKKYGVRTYGYDDYETCLKSGRIDAVYIALPNNLHADYAVRAAQEGIHVLCEKPLGVTERECLDMIDAARDNGARLMTAYRLHFEEANLRAIEIANSGRLGDVRAFSSVFTMPVKEGDIRLKRELGGGTLYDIGIYCVNAARNIFRDEPVEVGAFTATCDDPRFKEVEEMTSVTMRFSGNRLATFTVSFSASKISYYHLLGTKGDLLVDPAYGYSGELKYRITLNGRAREKSFSKRDQFAAELLYFSDCVLKGRDPEPSGEEGLADVRVIRALYESARSGRSVRLESFEKSDRPSLAQEIKKPPVKEPRLVNAESPSGGS